MDKNKILSYALKISRLEQQLADTNRKDKNIQKEIETLCLEIYEKYGLEGVTLIDEEISKILGSK